MFLGLSKGKLILYGLIVLALIIVGFIFGFKLAGGIGLGLLGIKKSVKKAKKKAKKDREKNKQMEKRAEKYQEEIDALNDDLAEANKEDEKINKKQKKVTERFKSFFNMMLIVTLLFTPVVVFAQEAQVTDLPTVEDAKELPDNYEGLEAQYFDLLDAYIELYGHNQNLYNQKEHYKELAHDYKDKLENVKLDLDEMIENDKQDEEMKQQLFDYIDKLLKRDGGFGIYGGVGISPLKPEASKLELGLTYDF